MRWIFAVLVCGSLLGCGSAQPTGDLNECTGQVNVTESNTDIFGNQNFNLAPGTTIGQYVRFRTGIVVKEIMINAYANNATSIKVSIYKNNYSDTMTASSLPIKEMTVTEGLTPNISKFQMWLVLPESFEFPATSDEDLAAGNMYFISFEPTGGTVNMYLNARDGMSRWRQGLRYGSGSNVFNAASKTNAMDMGFKGESNCQSTSN